MKKIFYILIAVLLLTIPTAFAEEATLTDVSCTKKTGGVESEINVTVKGLTMNVPDVVFEDAGDYLKCTFKVNNTSDDDLEVDKESILNKSDDKITYSLTSEEGFIIKKGETNTYNLDIEYIEEYEEAKTIDNEIEITLVGETINVPDTFITGFAIIVYVILLGVGLIILVITNKKTKALMFLLILLIIPSGYALTKISIKMTNKIIIDVTPKYDVIYKFEETALLTEEEAQNSKFLNIEKETLGEDEEGNPLYDVYYLGDDPTPYYNYYVEDLKETYKTGETVTLNDVTYYVLDDSASCEETPKADGTYTLNCDGERELKHVLSRDAYYWSYTLEGDELEELNFTGDGLIDNYSFNNPDGTFYKIIVRPPKTFIMPSHSVLFEPNSYEPLE